MDDFDSFAANEDVASTSQLADGNRSIGRTRSGITLVLPSLKAIKAGKVGKKSKLKNLAFSEDAEVKKVPRPMKLKPLKEVLSKLIAQLKKKDDYAFFISPVDQSKVPGYADVIKHPMDLGTMSTKVAKGKYRSLEEFTTDFRLVTGNAKTYNPSGSIYYIEADRLESWGLEHIAKSSAHVIEYETNWNIDIEQDEDTALNVDEDDDHITTSTPRDIEGSQVAPSPAPSSVPPQQMKRGPRGPYKKGASTIISEGIDAEGRLPGSREGVGAFPPNSDWAKMMIALKIKGKRYRTKKERLRIEKEGLPHLLDGSLDYTEMEDPFSVLSALAPELLSKPQLTPLYSSLQANHPTQPHFSGPVNTPTMRPSPTLAALGTSTSSSTQRRKHWTIVRNASTRAKLKDKDDDEPHSTEASPRDLFPSDFGSFAALGAELGASVCSQEGLTTTIRANIENRPIKRSLKAGVDSEYWTDEKAGEAWDYLRDVVYGGVEGFAYVRSIAEFVRPPEEFSDQTEHAYALGTPVAQYVEQHLINVVTRGRHELLCTTAAYLHSILTQPLTPAMEAQVAASLTFRPTVHSLIQALQHEPLDMAALIRTPEELEKAGLGELGILEDSAVLEQALESTAKALEELDQKLENKHEWVKQEPGDDDAMDVDRVEDDPAAKKLRLTLLALAKRAPLDKIAPLPAALVPAHIRKIVPTV